MMSQPVRTLIFWLLMVCVPVQGSASAIGGCCTRAQRFDQAFTASAAMQSSAPCEKHRTIGAAGHGKLQKVCHCAACGLGAVAPPPQAVQSEHLAAAIAVLTEELGSYKSFVPSGPDRPPKLRS